MLSKHPKVYNPAPEIEKKKFSKIYFYLFLILILLGGLIYFLFYSSYFKIKNILIENSASPEISQFFQRLNNQNIFRFNAGKIQDELALNFPAVKGAKIIRGLPDTLKIQFQERLSRVIWETQSRSYLIDENGEIYQETIETIDLPIIKDNNNIAVSVGQKILSENFLNFISDLNLQFVPATGFKVNHFEINETTFQADAITDQNWKVIFDTTRKASDQLADLQKFLKDHKDEVKEYIDLRVEGKVYYK